MDEGNYSLRSSYNNDSYSITLFYVFFAGYNLNLLQLYNKQQRKCRIFLLLKHSGPHSTTMCHTLSTYIHVYITLCTFSCRLFTTIVLTVISEMMDLMNEMALAHFYTVHFQCHAQNKQYELSRDCKGL